MLDSFLALAREFLRHSRLFFKLDAMRKIKAAGLDVFEGEPEINPAYRSLPNVFLLPHIGSATIETRTQMGFLLLDNLDAIFADKQPPNSLT